MGEIQLLQDYIGKHQKSCLIFDFDETLMRLNLPWDACLGDLLKDSDVASSGLIEQYANGEVSLSELQNKLVERFGRGMYTKICKNNERFETTEITGIDIYPELVEFVRDLHSQGYTLYLWSSNTKKAVTDALCRVHLEGAFQNMATRNDVLLLKPEPEGFYFLSNKKDTKREYLMIGNSHNDKRAAAASGIDFFQIRYFTRE